jgi:hypothetical protein
MKYEVSNVINRVKTMSRIQELGLMFICCWRRALYREAHRSTPLLQNQIRVDLFLNNLIQFLVHLQSRLPVKSYLGNMGPCC